MLRQALSVITPKSIRSRFALGTVFGRPDQIRRFDQPPPESRLTVPPKSGPTSELKFEPENGFNLI